MDLNFRPDQVQSLYLAHLQQMYSAEEQMLTAVPVVAIGLSVLEIRYLLLHEGATTPDRLNLLRKIFDELGETPTGPICQPMKDLSDLGMELTLHPFGPRRDLSLIAVALEMKHLSIAKYTMAATYARTLGLSMQNLFLSKVMRDEMEIDRKLRVLMQGIPSFTNTAETSEEKSEVKPFTTPPKS